MEAVGISVNKNMIPFDTRKPLDPSGVRIGAPALTTRGMKEAEMVKVVEFMDRAISNRDNEEELLKIKEEIVMFSLQYPVPGIE